MPRRIHFAMDTTMVHLNGRWRTPGSWVHRTYPSLDMLEDLVRLAERGCVDMVFFGDASGIPATWQGSHAEGARWGLMWPRQDMPPFYVARLLNSLDHITGGRIAFNVVASSRGADAANYGFDKLMNHNDRYDLMEEFIHVCRRLWDSIEPDAFLWDRETGEVVDPAKVHPVNHAGKYFKVAGPLSAVPSPQRHPVLLQAGGSERGIAASAAFADMVFIEAGTRATRQRHRAALDAALLAKGRDPGTVGMLVNTALMVGATPAEGRAKKERLLNLLPDGAVGPLLSYNLGFDLSKLPERFAPYDLQQQIIAAQASPSGMVAQLAEELGPTGTITRKDFFQLGRRFITGYQRTFAGSVAEVADFLEEEFEAMGGHGGFMLGAGYSIPGDFVDIVDYLLPEMQRRGRLRTRYEGKTLRENLLD